VVWYSVDCECGLTGRLTRFVKWSTWLPNQRCDVRPAWMVPCLVNGSMVSLEVSPLSGEEFGVCYCVLDLSSQLGLRIL